MKCEADDDLLDVSLDGNKGHDVKADDGPGNR